MTQAQEEVSSNSPLTCKLSNFLYFQKTIATTTIAASGDVENGIMMMRAIQGEEAKTRPIESIQQSATTGGRETTKRIARNTITIPSNSLDTISLTTTTTLIINSSNIMRLFVVLILKPITSGTRNTSR